MEAPRQPGAQPRGLPRLEGVRGRVLASPNLTLALPKGVAVTRAGVAWLERLLRVCPRRGQL